MRPAGSPGPATGWPRRGAARRRRTHRSRCASGCRRARARSSRRSTAARSARRPAPARPSPAGSGCGARKQCVDDRGGLLGVQLQAHRGVVRVVPAVDVQRPGTVEMGDHRQPPPLPRHEVVTHPDPRQRSVPHPPSAAHDRPPTPSRIHLRAMTDGTLRHGGRGRHPGRGAAALVGRTPPIYRGVCTDIRLDVQGGCS